MPLAAVPAPLQAVADTRGLPGRQLGSSLRHAPVRPHMPFGGGLCVRHGRHCLLARPGQCRLIRVRFRVRPLSPRSRPATHALPWHTFDKLARQCPDPHATFSPSTLAHICDLGAILLHLLAHSYSTLTHTLTLSLLPSPPHPEQVPSCHIPKPPSASPSQPPLPNSTPSRLARYSRLWAGLGSRCQGQG